MSIAISVEQLRVYVCLKVQRISALVLTCSMTGSGLLVTSSENKPSSAPSRTYCTMAGRETKVKCMRETR